MADRLFPVAGRTGSESAKNRARNLEGRMALFDTPDAEERGCPACGGIGDGCTCDRTGAEAIPLPGTEA